MFTTSYDLPPGSPVALLQTAGVSHSGRLIARGELVRLAPGIAVATESWRDLPPWDRYLARVHAAARARPDAVFSHESAAALWGLPTFGEPSLIHVLGSAHATSRVAAGTRTHSAQTPRSVVVRGGMLVTSLCDTVVDHARFRHPAVALAVADAALRLDPGLTVEQFTAANESRPSSRGRRVARWVLPRADARADGALESVSRAVIEWCGFEEPDLQRAFPRADGGEDVADFFWAGSSSIGESDGLVKYTSLTDAPARAVFEEKRREDRLRRQVRGFARWGWREVCVPAELRAILITAGVALARPEDGAPLASLRAAINGTPRRILDLPTREHRP